MCEYCNEGDRTTFSFGKDGERFDASGFVYPDSSELSATIYYNNHDIDVELKSKIHYCPMCGRKLGE